MLRRHRNRNRLSPLCSIILAGVSTPLVFSGIARGDIAFDYGPIAETINSASISVDVAEMTAHRTVFGNEVNYLRLVDVNTGLGIFDLSDDIFGTSSYPNIPIVNQGSQSTGHLTASIDSSFFPALASGQVGLWALLSDTGDAMFAIDSIILEINTTSTTITSTYGSANDGFGIGVGDGGNLPTPLPTSVPFGATGTGFDETITSKSIYAVPAPASVLALLGGLFVVRRRRRLNEHHLGMAAVASWALIFASTNVHAGPTTDPPDPADNCGIQQPDDGGCLQDHSFEPAGPPKPDFPDGSGDPDAVDSWIVVGYDTQTGEFIEPSDPSHVEVDPGLELIEDGAFGCASLNCDNGTASVIGPDGRIEMTNTNSFALSATCFLVMTFPNGNVYTGSGMMVGPRHVLTAGHNVHDPADGGWASTVRVYPGSKDWAKANPRPYGRANMTRMYSYRGWTVSRQRQHDFALLVLDSNIGNRTGWMGKWAGSTDVNQVVHIKQYPGDKPTGSQWSHWGQPTAESADGYLSFYPIDTFRGSSGSAVYRLAGAPIVRYVRAVHTAGVGDGQVGQGNNNVGTRLTTGKFERIQAWIAANPPLAIAKGSAGVDPCDVCGPDCNGNGISDETDISEGTSFDEDGNGVPDECEPDQLHIVGPIPNNMTIDDVGSINVSVQRNFSPLENMTVVFEALEGEITFTGVGAVQPDGYGLLAGTDVAGEATGDFTANAAGTVLVRVYVPGTNLETYASFEIKPEPSPAKSSDLTGDGIVNVNDLLLLLGAWGTVGSSIADIAPPPNGDEQVNINDLLELISRWGRLH